MNILTLLESVKKYPHVFKIAAGKPTEKGTWGAYKYDDVMSIWIDTSHPVAIAFFKEEREERMGYELTVQEQNNLSNFLQQNQQRIADVLPPDVRKFMTPSRLTQIAYQALVEKPDVGRCEPASIVNAIIGAASLGLQIGGELGQASLVPFKNRAKLMVEWRGYMAFANKTGKVKNWFVSLVYENEKFEIQGGNNQQIIHHPLIGKGKGELIAAYAMCRIHGDDRDKFVVIDQMEADRIKSHSAANRKADSPWNTQDVGRMWLKTAVKQLCRTYLISLTPDMAQIISVDDQVESESEQFNYIQDVTPPQKNSPDSAPASHQPSQPDNDKAITQDTKKALFAKMTSAGIAKEQMEGFYKFALMGQKPTEHWGKLFLENFDNCLKGWFESKEPVKQSPSPAVDTTPSVSAEAHPETQAIELEQQPADNKQTAVLPNVQNHLSVMREENPEGYKEACQMLDIDPSKPHNDQTAQEILSAMSVSVS